MMKWRNRQRVVVGRLSWLVVENEDEEGLAALTA